MIGYDAKNSVSLDHVLRETPCQFPAFVKIDIEGAEYRVLDDLILHAANICGLAIEFHDVDLHQDRIVSFVQNFPLTLVHIHGNNFSTVDPFETVMVIEMSFARDPIEIASEPSIPHPLDRPCNPAEPEIQLFFEPTETTDRKSPS